MVGPAKVYCQEITPHNRPNARGLLGEKERVWEWRHERNRQKDRETEKQDRD